MIHAGKLERIQHGEYGLIFGGETRGLEHGVHSEGWSASCWRLGDLFLGFASVSSVFKILELGTARRLEMARERRALLPAIFILAALTACPMCFAKRKKPPPPPPDVSDHVRELAQKLYGMALDDAEPITGEIEKAVLSDLNAWAANRAPTDVEMRRELERVFSKLHYPLIGDPAVLAAAWNGRTLFCAGYTLGWTDTNKVNVLAMFESAGGKTHRVTVTNFVPHTDLHFEALPAAASGDFRFITYGNRLGKSQVRLTAILYGYDGQALDKLWEVDDAY